MYGDFDFQNAWNNHAADYNAAVLRDRYAEPDVDPRMMAAQSLVQRYAPKPPSYANINGNYFINGEPFQAPQGFEGPDAEAAAQHQFAQARQQAAQSMIARRSGDYSAGTAGRTLLTDPQFMRMAQLDQDAVYQRAYGNTLAEDMQADHLGGAHTIADIRRLNQLPQIQKTNVDWLNNFGSQYGSHAGLLVSGYNDQTGVSHLPGAWVMERDETGNERPVQKPGMDIPIDARDIMEARRRMALNRGDEFYTPPASMPQQPSPFSIHGMAQSLGWTPPARDPERDAKFQQAKIASQDALRRNGEVVAPDQLPSIMELATSFANGKQFTEEQLVAAARMINQSARRNVMFSGIGDITQQALRNQRAREMQELAARSPFGDPETVPDSGGWAF